MVSLVNLVIYVDSLHIGPKKIWIPLKPDQVPEWIKDDPDIVANLRAGYAVQNSDFGDSFYMGREVETTH